MKKLFGLIICITTLSLHASEKFFLHAKLPPLIQAATDGDYKMVKGLLIGGVNPNAQDGPKESTALMWAAGNGHITIVALLLSYGARVNIQDAKGKTALDYARKSGHADIIKILETHGARNSEVVIPALLIINQVKVDREVDNVKE